MASPCPQAPATRSRRCCRNSISLKSPLMLLADLKAWRMEVEAQPMEPNPAYDPTRENEGPPKKPKKKNTKKENGQK